MTSASPTDAFAQEWAGWNIFDANVRVGPSGVHGTLAQEPPALLEDMDRFGIERALVSHFAAEEYDAVEGNRALARDAHPRFVPAWSVSPDVPAMEDLAPRNPRAVRLWFSALRHNFSSARWCAGALFEYLEERQALAVVSREEIEWNALAELLANFPRLNVLLLDSGYRCDRYLFPLLRKHPNLFFDSATYVAHRQLECFVEGFGPERVVFGSRLPLYTPGAALAVLATARIPEAARLAIAGGNLRRLLRESA